MPFPVWTILVQTLLVTILPTRNRSDSPCQSKWFQIYEPNTHNSPSQSMSSRTDIPDPPSRCHLQRCLRSLLLVAYYLYASVGTPRRLASNTFLMPRALQNPLSLVHKHKFDGGFWISPLFTSRALNLRLTKSTHKIV
jgi:hypothetical protein